MKSAQLKVVSFVFVGFFITNGGTAAVAQVQSGPPSNGSPGWHLQTAPKESPGRIIVDPGGQVRVLDDHSVTAQTNGSAVLGELAPCSHSPTCDRKGGPNRQQLHYVVWDQTMGYTYAYPIDLPFDGGAQSTGIDSKGNFWVFQRNAPGQAQLSEFGLDHKLIRTVGDNVIGHQFKAHGMAIDANDNVWICDANGATVEEVGPDGRLLKTIGVRGHEGDWDEAKKQRFLWQPLDVAFAPNGDIYIGEGHANESPNDTNSDPTNKCGCARVIHLDKDGNFINQWYGNDVGQGKFSMVHGIAVDPKNGDVWLADREQYRLVVYTSDGKFLKTIQMRNLTCTVAFDPHGNLWIGSGLDGQLLKINRNGKVLGAVGRGPGRGVGQFHATNYMAWDKQGNIYTGDSINRITEFVAPENSRSTVNKRS